MVRKSNDDVMDVEARVREAHLREARDRELGNERKYRQVFHGILNSLYVSESNENNNFENMGVVIEKKSREGFLRDGEHYVYEMNQVSDVVNAGYKPLKVGAILGSTTFLGGWAYMRMTRPFLLRHNKYLILGVNGFLSFLVAGAVYMISYDGFEREAYKKIAKSPLYPGRSVVADRACSDWVKATRSIPEGFWEILKKEDEVIRKPSKTFRERFRRARDDFIAFFTKRRESEPSAVKRNRELWQAIAECADNCRRREIYSRILRKDMDIKSDEPVLIPEPGVPIDIDHFIKELMFDEEEEENAKQAPDNFYDQLDMDTEISSGKETETSFQ